MKTRKTVFPRNRNSRSEVMFPNNPGVPGFTLVPIPGNPGSGQRQYRSTVSRESQFPGSTEIPGNPGKTVFRDSCIPGNPPNFIFFFEPSYWVPDPVFPNFFNITYVEL